MDIRKIYFYVISLISLLIVLFSSQHVLSTTLRYFVFKTVDMYTYQPPFAFFSNYPSKIDVSSPDFVDTEKKNEEMVASLEIKNLTKDDRAKLDGWKISYSNWKKDQANTTKSVMDGLVTALTAILIFTPTFVYHFKTAIKKETLG